MGIHGFPVRKLSTNRGFSTSGIAETEVEFVGYHSDHETIYDTIGSCFKHQTGALVKWEFGTQAMTFGVHD